jgi:hypothetical protein
MTAILCTRRILSLDVLDALYSLVGMGGVSSNWLKPVRVRVATIHVYINAIVPKSLQSGMLDLLVGPRALLYTKPK